MKFTSAHSKKFTFTILLMILFCVVFASLSLRYNNKSQINMNNDERESIRRIIPKSSSTEIIITTPENITYSGPMSGYYPATYGFEDEENGTSRLEIEYIDAVSTYGTCEIVESYSNIKNKEHKKILHVEDPYDGPGMHFRHFLDKAQTTGFVEFWFVMTDKWASVAENILFYSMDDSDNIGFRLGFHGNYFMDTQSNTAPMSYNTWYHINIEFDCSNGTNGLFDWYINGILQYSDVEMQSNIDEISQLSIRGYSASRGEGYFDAFGLSWDPNYTVGDNLNEGMLLNFETNTNLDWIGYSLDGQANETISGNSTISMPSKGLHRVQIFGNNSLGDIFESDIRYFTIKYPPITIITPKNITYTEPMSGYYPATYGFENDKVGIDALYWEDTSDANCNSYIIQEKTRHKKVVYMDDDNGGGKARFINDFIDQDKGTVEFWYLPEDATTWFSFRLIDMDLLEVRLEINVRGDKWHYYDGVILYEIPNVPIPQDNVWQHVKIYFECTSGGYHGLSQYKFETFINGISSGELPFQVDGGDIDRLYFSSLNIGTTDSWVDAVGFSWDPNYNIGDNLYEGLLLSFTNKSNLDWIGYSLDGQLNKTILGNTTIPLSGNGIHNIRVFGRNSSGYIFESPLRYFTIDIASPQIFINSPHNGDYFGSNAPSFSISIMTPIIDTSWYTLNNGSMIIFNGLIGTIDQSEWDRFGQEFVIIRFYVNDTFGQVSFKEITVVKDIYPTMPPLFDFLIVFIILIAVGFTIINIFVIRKIKSRKFARGDIIYREESTADQKFTICPFCQTESKASYKFCIHCGSKLND